MSTGSRLILVALLCLTSLYAQEKKTSPSQKPVEGDDVVRVNTELVQTDVMVFDKDGRFVSGLQKEQFELLVEDQPQPITLFESVTMGSRKEDAVLRASQANKGVEETPETSEHGRTILFFINDYHLEPGSLARTHKLINHFIDNQLGPNDEVAITSASGQIGFLQQLTDNPIVLRAALERLKYVPGGPRDSERPPMTDYAAYLISERNDRQLFAHYVNETVKVMHVEPSLAEAMVTRRVSALLRQSDIVVKTALSSLVNLMGATAKLSGRKLVFFISDGFIPNFTGSDFTTMMGRATRTAARAGVVIYSLDARGLSVDSSLDASTSGGFDPTGIVQSRISGERSFKQEALHALSADTGGRALLNSNALEDAVGRALDETSRYYLLAWRPNSEAQRKSDFSKVKVSIVGRPDLKVRLRRGYLGAPDVQNKPKVEPASNQLETTDDLGIAESSTDEIRVALALGYKQTPGNNVQLTSSVQVSADGSSGTIVANVLGAVFDSKGKAVGSFRQRVEVPRSRAPANPAYTYVNHQVDLPPGLYQVRTLAHERGTTRLTSAMEWIELPKLKSGTFSISSLYIGEISATEGTGQVGVNASRRFARTSRLRFTTYIYNAKSPPQLALEIRILRGNQAVITPPETKVSTEKLSSFATIPYTGEFPLNALPPGNYVLELKVTDRTASASASQQFKFTVY